MRITLGMSLEAWVPTDAAAPPMAMGAWRAGEVVWGNGHSYVMRWFDGGPDSGRILRKFVRPLPDPAVKLPADLVPGDNVEVLDGSLWKWAEVVSAAGHADDGPFEVKIVGSSQVLTADRGALRPRQVYGEKGWVVLHKGNKIPVESVVPSRPIPGKNIHGKANNGNNLGGGKFAAPHAVKLAGTTTTKRSSCSVTADGDVAPDAKRFHFHSSTKLFPKEAPDGKRLQSSIKLFPKEAPDGKRLQSSIKLFPKEARYPSHCYLMKKRRQETSNDNKSYNEESCDVVGGTVRDSSDTDDGSSSSSTSDRSSSSADGSDGDSSSSSGSNSNGGVPEFPAAGERCQDNREASIPPPPLSREEEEQDSDDGRASATMDHRRRVDEDEEEAVTTMKRNRQAAEVHEDHGRVVHGLELEAYVSVMKAFRATGPLSWAKEELLSDLRLHLHVSGDEHLQLIRSLNGNS